MKNKLRKNLRVNKISDRVQCTSRLRPLTRIHLCYHMLKYFADNVLLVAFQCRGTENFVLIRGVDQEIETFGRKPTSVSPSTQLPKRNVFPYVIKHCSLIFVAPATRKFQN